MQGIAVLLAISVAAESASEALELPVPGSILGLIGLVAWFAWRGSVPCELAAPARTLVGLLALLLVPVGVSVVDLAGDVTAELIVLVGVSIAATVLAIVSTAAVVRLVGFAAQRLQRCQLAHAGIGIGGKSPLRGSRT